MGSKVLMVACFFFGQMYLIVAFTWLVDKQFIIFDLLYRSYYDGVGFLTYRMQLPTSRYFPWRGLNLTS